jgi:ABC-type lipoprotein export system ATPase subunit
MDEKYSVILEEVPLNGTSKISLKVKKGQRILIKGDQGSGKTTLLKIVVGLVDPPHGNAILFGKNIKLLPQFQLLKLRRKVTYLGYPMGLIENWTVYDNITLPLKYHWQMKNLECEKRIKGLETYLGSVQDLLFYPVAQLNDEKQKVITVFRGMVIHPELVLLDLDEMQLTNPDFVCNLIRYIVDHKMTAMVTDSSNHTLEGTEELIIFKLS